MNKEDNYCKSLSYLKTLCQDIPERCVGSEGNRLATRFFEEEISSFGWDTETQEFDAIDWRDGGATLQVGNEIFEVFVSPYSLGCAAAAQLAGASSINELKRLDLKGKIVFLHGGIAKEQLMPKNFVFYNPEEHRNIVSLLENCGARAAICATERNAALAGGVYPFPLIEDGDFNVPSVYMTAEEGKRLLPYVGKEVQLNAVSTRIPGKGYNIIGRKGKNISERIVITAHIDAKKGTPGAIDNATGVVVLLLLAGMMEGYAEDKVIEIAALNGEDYFAVPGQMSYIAANRDKFDTILFNINIDGAGYREGKSAFSFYNLPAEIRNAADQILERFPGITEGLQWPQGDHSIFIQYGRPAIAVSSSWFTENIATQEITHTEKDSIGIVDCHKLVEIAEAIAALLFNLAKENQSNTGIL